VRLQNGKGQLLDNQKLDFIGLDELTCRYRSVSGAGLLPEIGGDITQASESELVRTICGDSSGSVPDYLISAT
jgi:hypothetical protein